MGRLYLFMAKTAWKKTLKLNEKCLPMKDFIIGEFTRGGEGGHPMQPPQTHGLMELEDHGHVPVLALGNSWVALTLGL